MAMMKVLSSILLASIYMHSASSLPIDDRPGFTPWPIEKRAIIPEDIFSSNKFGAMFRVEDDMCRGHLPGTSGKCWTMMDATVDKMRENRAGKTKDCKQSCLFYTAGLSGAAERHAGFVLRAALTRATIEGERKHQTIWDLHDKKFYPNPDNWAETPETRCIYQDREDGDAKEGYNGCQRSYFMSMSKAMAMECTGEVFLMTSSKLNKKKRVPEDGIWWQAEFPTLIDKKRPANSKVTKITYLQVKGLTKEQFDALTPEQMSKAPPIIAKGEYWPNGPGAAHLKNEPEPNEPDTDPEDERESKRLRSLSDSNNDAYSLSEEGFEELERRAGRASSQDNEVLDQKDPGYPFYYSIDNMVKWYGDMGW